MRKVLAGQSRHHLALVLHLRGYHAVLGTPGVNSLKLRLPPALWALQGWRDGQPVRRYIDGQAIHYRAAAVANALGRSQSRRRTPAQRIRFERRWAEMLRQLRRGPRSRRWDVVRVQEKRS